jgi:uncharacterized protein YhdP
LSSTFQAPDAAAPRSERRRHRGGRAAWRIAFTALFGLWSLLLLAWLILQWGIVPRVAQYKPQIEARASAALGVPVTIGAIRARSSGWMPLFELDDVALAPRAGQAGEALRLPRVSAALSARSILGLSVRFEQLHVEGAALEVRRDAAGRFFVAGNEVRSGVQAAADDASGTDWLLAQREVVVRQGRVRWIDERQAAPPLDLSAVDVVLRNRLGRHEIRVDATPPAEVGQRFTLQGTFREPLLAARSDWQRWSGTAYAELPHTDAAALRRWLHGALPFEVPAGEGALRVWADVADGQPQSVQADVALRDVQVRFRGRAQPLVLQRLQGRLSAAREQGTLKVAAEPLAFVSTGAGGTVEVAPVRWALQLRERTGPDGTQVFDGGQLDADRIDLAALAALAAPLPLGGAVDKLLADTAPSGQVRNLVARWEGALDAPRSYQVKAQAQGLSIAAGAPPEGRRLGRPGWRNATVDFEASEAGGRAQLSMQQGVLILPGFFEQPEVAFDSFGTRLSWRITPQREAPAAIEVMLTDTQLANADMQGRIANAVWRSGAGTGFARGGRFPGQLDVTAQITQGRATAVARYLPLGLPEKVRNYVRQAVTDGRVTGVQIAVKGDLFDFPFAPYTLPGARAPVVPQGTFRIVGKAQDVDFAYVPGDGTTPSPWPAFTRVAGELVFDRNTMEIRGAQARVWGVELSQVQGGIRELGKPVLKLDGSARGPAADMLRYVNASPVAGWTANALREATASGAADLKLALELPLGELERSSVQGSVQLQGNDVRIVRGTPLLADATGRVSFSRNLSQAGFTVAGARARVLGGELSFDGGVQSDGALRFNGQGVASAEALRQSTDFFGPLARLASSASGQTPYRLALGFVRGRTEFTLTSP